MVSFDSKYPKQFDNESNLFTVHDSLYVYLAKDHQPGETAIHVDGDISLFPPSGIITLVDHCSDPNERTITFYYSSRTGNQFNVELMDYSKDSFKPKKLTMVTQQVVAETHNNIKNAIMAIENFLGPTHHQSSTPYGTTIFGRINFLKKALFAPKAWFEANIITGLTPLTVRFTSRSFGTAGPVGEVIYEWDFGDGEQMTTSDASYEKIYMDPGVYTVSLKVKNDYGSDYIELKGMIKAKAHAPKAAKLNLTPQPNQLATEDRLRTPTNQLISIDILDTGEQLNPDTKEPYDKIVNYTWGILDTLPHANSPKTKALFSLGGRYDLVLRTDTELGAYRITTYEDYFDVVEPTNLWLWTTFFNRVRCHEFGLVSETFKANSSNPRPSMNDSFIKDNPNFARMRSEFLRNNGVAAKGNGNSGSGGSCILYWPSGRGIDDPLSSEKINLAEYNPFADIYSWSVPSISRPWNWAALASPDNIYFILGNDAKGPLPTVSPTNQTKTILDLHNLSTHSEQMTRFNYKNGAHDLVYNTIEPDKKGESTYGHFSSYRTAWKGHEGYILSNEGAGEKHYFKKFYKTEGVIGSPFMSLTRVADLPTNDIYEGQLAALSNGIFFFNNSGTLLVYNDVVGTWQANNANALAFHALQDRGVKNHDDTANTLLVASDGNRRAYLSFDYSPDSFIKFNGADLTFSTVGPRPNNKQWAMTIF